MDLGQRLERGESIGTYGTLGTGSAAPCRERDIRRRVGAISSGNFWLFGGLGYDSTGTVGSLNDLWGGNYNSGGQWIWTWMAGSNVAGAIDE